MTKRHLQFTIALPRSGTSEAAAWFPPCACHDRGQNSMIFPVLSRISRLMLFPVPRLALVCLASLALSGCLSEDSALLSPVSSQIGLARDPKLLVATTRLPVGDPPRKPWFSSERSPDLVFAEARL